MAASYTFSLAPDHRRSVSVVAEYRNTAQTLAEVRMAKRLTLLGEIWLAGNVLELRNIEGEDDVARMD